MKDEVVNCAVTGSRTHIEHYSPTTNLRLYERLIDTTLSVTTYGRVMQQEYISGSGSLKWVDVPVIREGHPLN